MKRLLSICILAFFIGCAGGGAFAYATNQGGHASGLGALYNEWKVARFIDKQEEERPDGMTESKIETGSKYTGITYNAPAKPQNNTVAPTPSQPEQKPAAEKEGIFSGITSHFSKNDSNSQQPESQEVVEEKITRGRIAIQNGTLNVRDQGSTSGKIIGQVRKDDIVQIIGQEGDWYKVITAGGLNGYVSATYVRVIEE